LGNTNPPVAPSISRLEARMVAYAAYHRNPWNKFFHLLGVPVVTFSLFVGMAWFRFTPTEFPLSVAMIFFASVLINYLRLDWQLMLFTGGAFFPLLYLAEMLADQPFAVSGSVFLAATISGWTLQLIGHWFEGRRPALLDNFMQIFNAPLFVTLEVLFFLGFRRELRARIEAGSGTKAG